jgi:hypothetical protein
MEPWPIIKLTLIHCALVLAVSAIFAVTLWALGYFYPPNSIVLWWFKHIDLMLAIFTPTTLAIAFVSSVGRIVLDAIILTWRGFPHGNSHIILV